MSSDNYYRSNTLAIEHCVELIDVFIEVGNGQIRRATIPLKLLSVLGWFENTPGTDIRDGDLHASFCREAEQSQCGYSEAMVNILTAALEHSSLGEKYDRAFSSDETVNTIFDAFIETQFARAKRWREVNNDWRDELPPVLD